MDALMEKKIRNLRKEIKNLRAENKELGHQLNVANTVLNNFKKIFTEGQMRKMIFPDRTVKWSWKDISNAICLHAAGPIAYTHLYEKGFPLPHVSTLQRWHQRNDLVDGLLTPPNDSPNIDIPELCDEEKTAVIPIYSEQK